MPRADYGRARELAAAIELEAYRAITRTKDPQLIDHLADRAHAARAVRRSLPLPETT